MLEKSCSSRTDTSDSSYKCAVDDSLCEENYAHPDCINASNLHNNCAADNLQIEKDQCEGGKFMDFTSVMFLSILLFVLFMFIEQIVIIYRREKRREA